MRDKPCTLQLPPSSACLFILGLQRDGLRLTMLCVDRALQRRPLRALLDLAMGHAPAKPTGVGSATRAPGAGPGGKWDEPTRGEEPKLGRVDGSAKLGRVDSGGSVEPRGDPE